MKQPAHFLNTNGFTLIELIVSMVIIGLIGFGASLFFVYAAKGYMLTRANTELFQKTNLAMERLIRETKQMDTVYSVSATSISFQRDGEDFGISLVGTDLKLIRSSQLPDASTPGSTLIDNVSAFNLSFEDADGNTWTVPADNSLTGLSRIIIQLTIDIENTSRTFTMEVNPVYNDTINGPTS